MVNKKIFFFIFLTFLILGISLFLINETSFDKKENNLSKICINENCFWLEVADTKREQESGLMFREKIGTNREDGMIFIFEEESEPGFWMKNTLINLDILWISKNKSIIGFVENISKCVDVCEVYFPPEKIKYVIELRGGEINDKNILLGDLIYFSEEK